MASKQGNPNKPLPDFDVTLGPFVGVCDAVELTAQSSEGGVPRAMSMINAYPRVPEIGGDVWQRPGLIERTVPTTVGGIANFAGPIVLLAGYVTPTGTLTNLLLVRNSTNAGLGGADYFQFDATHNYPVIQYTAPSTYAVVAGGGTGAIGINDPALTANRFFFATLGTYALFSQSGGKCRKFVLSTGVISPLTDMTDDVYGRPAIYFGRLFMIKNDTRQRIVWSEVNDPDTGYEASGFANFWNLQQTSSAAINALAGTNQALYVFRQNSITQLQGTPNNDFASVGTVEGISNRTGTLAPDSLVVVENAVWFLDQFCRPNVIPGPSQEPIPLWLNANNSIMTFADVTATVQFGNWGRYISELDVVIFRVMSTTPGTALFYVYSARTQEYIGLWSMNATSAEFGASLFDSDGRAMFALIKSLATDPRIFNTQKADAATDQRDVFGGTTSSPAFSIKTPKMQADLDMAVSVDAVTVSSQEQFGNVPPVVLQFEGSNFSTTVGVTVTPASLGGPSSGPTRAFMQPDLRQSRWVSVTASNDLANATRPVLGQFRIRGTQQRTDPSFP